MKACISKQTNLHDFPDKVVVLRSYGHDLLDLLDLAGLKLQWKLDSTPATNPGLGISWQGVKDWNERARYQQKTEDQARELYRAVTDVSEGVLPWVEGHW